MKTNAAGHGSAAPIGNKRENREMDPETIKSIATLEWRQSLTGFLIKFGILTAIFVGVLVALLVTGSAKEAADNWSRYRCNPLVIPFADFFGYDSAENFQYCVRAMMQEQSGEYFQPVYQLLGQYSSSLGMIVNTVAGFRQTLGNFKLSTDTFIGSVMAKIQALMFQVRMSFMKMQTLMGRVYGTMYSIIWMGTSGIMAGQNLADNDLVNFMFEFCFAPDTQVRMANGSVKAIQAIQVGDLLEHGIPVTSTFQFQGQKTPMVQIHGDTLSAEHRVFHNNQWIPAHQHPSALPTSSLPLLCCLNVAGHAFTLASGLRVADYDESSDPVAAAAAQRLAEAALNGGFAAAPVADYSLGFDGAAEVLLADGTWIAANSLQLGDVVSGGATVCGLVRESCASTCVHGGVRVAAAQLVYTEPQKQWRRAATVSAAVPAILTQCITDTCAPLCIRAPGGSPLFLRDYREAPLPDMEAPYLAALAAASAKN
jgi:hypothetical protein